jgi:predicted HTH transcriptional regulator
LRKRLDGKPADAREDKDLEFEPWESDLKTLHRLLWETVFCPANALGGTIVLGIRDGVRTGPGCSFIMG